VRPFGPLLDVGCWILVFWRGLALRAGVRCWLLDVRF